MFWKDLPLTDAEFKQAPMSYIYVVKKDYAQPPVLLRSPLPGGSGRWEYQYGIPLVAPYAFKLKAGKPLRINSGLRFFCFDKDCAFRVTPNISFDRTHRIFHDASYKWEIWYKKKGVDTIITPYLSPFKEIVFMVQSAKDIAIRANQSLGGLELVKPGKCKFFAYTEAYQTWMNQVPEALLDRPGFKIDWVKTIQENRELVHNGGF